MEYQLNDIPLAHGHERELIEWLGNEGFLSIDQRECNNCGGEMILQRYTQWQDQHCLRCTTPQCHSRQSVREGSFFANSNLSLSTQMHLLVLFGAESSQAVSARACDVSYNTVVDFFHRCRQLYNDDVENNPIVLDENGIYEIDEAQIQRVLIEGDLYLPIIWIAGILERETGRVILYRIVHRNFQELLPPINFHIPAGSLICSDELPAYNPLHGEGSLYLHHTVNHSAGEYARIDNIPGWGPINVHINTIEGLWTHVRTKLKYATRRNIPYIDFMLREVMYRRSNRNLFDPFKLHVNNH